MKHFFKDAGTLRIQSGGYNCKDNDDLCYRSNIKLFTLLPSFYLPTPIFQPHFVVLSLTGYNQRPEPLLQTY